MGPSIRKFPNPLNMLVSLGPYTTLGSLFIYNFQFVKQNLVCFLSFHWQGPVGRAICYCS